MTRNSTWINRIKAGDPISQEILDRGYVSVGWQCEVSKGHADDPLAWADDPSGCLRRFVEVFEVGDAVVVPHRDGVTVGIYIISGDPIPVSSMPERLKSSLGSICGIDSEGLYDERGDGTRRHYDIGFLRPVSRVRTVRRRDLPEGIRGSLHCHLTNFRTGCPAVPDQLSA